MSKEESLNLVESTIADVEEQLKILDHHAGYLANNRVSIAKLEGALADVQNNPYIDAKLRASRHSSASSLLTLERGDQAALNSKIDNQSNYVVESWRRAVDLLQQTWSALLE